MKRLYSLFIMLSFSLSMMAQNSVTGMVTEAGGDDPLIGASVFLKGTSKGTVTDLDGKFTLENVNNGDYVVEISYLGFSAFTQNITVDGNLDLGTLTLEPEGVGLAEVLVVSSVAVDRKTPIAVTTLKGDVIEAKLGNQEYPEILRKTPSVYVTKQGGGFGDARINVRGFSQEYFAVMINGIPVNDMENGRVFWSNWAGLSDVTNRLQYQRGLGATKLAVPTVGGSINIITNPAEFRQGGSASVAYGNDNYLKASASYSTGLSESGWAATFQLAHTRGDGYVDGTAFRAYSYFGAISKSFGGGKHMLSATFLGAPQWHHQRVGASRFDRISLRTFNDPDNTGDDATNLGIKWNHTWGMLNGEEFNWRRNFYHKPKAFLNHYWNISEKVQLKTSVYYSTGRGGGTGPRGRLRTPGSIFDSFSGLSQGIHDQNGQVRFDDIVRYNQGQEVAGWGSKEASDAFGGRFVVSEDGRIYLDANGNVVSDDLSDWDSRSNAGSGFIRRASVNSHNWIGALSTLSAKLSESVDLTAGIDIRDYTGLHYRRLENLLGADGYSSKSNINNQSNLITTEYPATFGNFSDNAAANGDDLNYNNDGRVRWLGTFGQIEYSKDDLSIFTSVSVANQGFKRIDYFNYLNSDSQRESEWQNYWGGQFKAGLNYNLNEKNNVYFNGGFYSKQPLFDNVFLNFRNDINPDFQNEDITSFEIGYGYRSSNLRIDAGLYRTEWTNRQFDIGVDLANEEEGLAQFRGVGQTHQGLEVEIDYYPSSKFSIDAMASIGDWQYSSNFEASITNTDSGQPAGDLTIFGDGLKIGDAAQTLFSIGGNYNLTSAFSVNADITYFDRLFARYDIDDDQFQAPGGQVAQLPSYSLVDAGLSYNFEIGENRSNIRLNINNVLNTKYISDSFTNIVDDPATERNEIYDNRGFWGFGTTWNMRYKVWF